MAQTPPNQSEYLRNIIQKVKDAAPVQQFPALNESKDSAPAPTTTTSLPQALSSNSAPAQLYAVRHGQLPSNREYWRFLNYYRSHSVISLIVSGIDEKQLGYALSQLPQLQQRGVQIGEVIVTSGKYAAEVNVADRSIEPPAADGLTPEENKVRSAFLNKKLSPLGSLAKSIGLGIAEPVDLTQILKRLSVRYSPTWVVRHHGVDYVYEGIDSPLRLFSKDGRFLEGRR